MDEIAKKIASLGLPGIVLVIAVASSGGVGGTYAVIAAIAGLGGPFGIIGGLTVLGLMTAVGDVLAGYGIEALLSAVYGERKKSESVRTLIKEVKDLPISEHLKLKLESLLEPDNQSKSSPDTEPRTVEIVE